MANTWTLENMDDNMDAEEMTVGELKKKWKFKDSDWPGGSPPDPEPGQEQDDIEQMVIRHHWVVVIWRHEIATAFASQVNKLKTVLSFKCGDRTIYKGTVGMSTAGSKFLCVSDGASAEGGGQTAYLRRRQVWETYDKWELAPQEWQTNKVT